MIGNDVSKDMIAETLDINVFLLTDSMTNKSGEDINRYKHGSFEKLIECISKL